MVFNRPRTTHGMRLSPRLKKMLNDQIGMELYAANYYLSMASWCEATGYEGSAKQLYMQADEERAHMMKIVQHLNEIGAGAVIPSVVKPPGTFKSLEAVFKLALKNEQAVTVAFDKMTDAAQKAKDHATFAFLQWFVSEQIEEEKKMETILQKFDLLGRDKIAVYEVDKIIGAMEPEPAAAA
ncbi:ferritin-like protein [Cenarchaeum symbiosum A]|uniref:Ferritin-like protein n=1 Tax=Cenarchaeum symbiosum (strain A) TaxID=414004 RepID=A0RYL9_CENSY|nr:ferritin-like protein [Cenarchaeum symbiosum A]